MGGFFKKVGKGLITLLPIIILVWIFSMVYGLFEGMFYYVFGITDNNLKVTLVIFVVSLVFLYYIGHLLEKNKEFILLKTTELVINKIPVIKSVYSVIKDLVSMFSKEKDKSYLGVCYLKFSDTRVIGFITQKEKHRLTVFVPTTPNPTSGLLFFVDEKDVEYSDMSVKDGFRKIVSLGLK